MSFNAPSGKNVEEGEKLTVGVTVSFNFEFELVLHLEIALRILGAKHILPKAVTFGNGKTGFSP